MARENWYYVKNANDIPEAINVISVVRYYPLIRKIGLFLAFYRNDQFVNAECWIDENLNSLKCFENDAGYLDDENLSIHMAKWLDNRADELQNFSFGSKYFSIKGVEECYPNLFEVVRKFVWDKVYPKTNRSNKKKPVQSVRHFLFEN